MHVYSSALPYVSNARLDVVQPYLKRSFATFKKTEAEKLVTWDHVKPSKHDQYGR
jgi:hypothetical protein